MNKAQLIQTVAAKGGRRLSPTEAVEIVLDVMVRAVVEGDRVSVTGFGSLTPRDRPAREAYNPQTGAKVMVAATRVVKFRPGARFKDLLTQHRPMPESGNCLQKDPKTPRP
ncbi:HU family DNA-binding protein [Streptomyces sp. NPDC057623]|uniref:HU family DNA-binding protein n=1 Tax=Streptomyces sp. NPDC057623 TaxID=3346187 RepID=UPI0036B67B85